MDEIIFYLAILSLFALKLLAGVSINPALRAKLSNANFIAFIFWGTILLVSKNKHFSALSAAHFFLDCMVLPETIARIVNLRRAKPILFQTKRSLMSFLFGLTSAALLLLLTVVLAFFVFNENRSSNSLNEIGDLLVRLNFLLVFVAGAIWFYLLATERTSFYSKGLLHDNEIWLWSDFHSYAWRKAPVDKDTKALALNVASSARKPRQVIIKIPVEDQSQVELFLASKLKRNSVSV